ncbi:MAG: NifU N-terminal domain-containing protein [Caldilineaceae bacterium]
MSFGGRTLSLYQRFEIVNTSEFSAPNLNPTHAAAILPPCPYTFSRRPNPNALVVLPQKMFDRPLNISADNVSSAEQATAPLALQLLALESIYNVFMVQDFVTVNKYPGDVGGIGGDRADCGGLFRD